MKESTHTTFLKRRQFLRTSTLGLAAVAADQKSGILSAQPLGLPIGLELFTVRSECEQDFPGTLEKVAAIGYKEVELFDFYGRKASEIRRLWSSAGLVAPSSHTLSYILSPQSQLSEVRPMGKAYRLRRRARRALPGRQYWQSFQAQASRRL